MTVIHAYTKHYQDPMCSPEEECRERSRLAVIRLNKIKKWLITIRLFKVFLIVGITLSIIKSIIIICAPLILLSLDFFGHVFVIMWSVPMAILVYLASGAYAYYAIDKSEVMMIEEKYDIIIEYI